MAQGIRQRIGRLAASLAVPVYVALAIAISFDRLAPQSFSAEQMTPAVFRVQAEVMAANRLIEAGIPESATGSARKLVERDPLGTGSASLFGASLLGKGDGVRADRALRIAARRGWRDARTQLYWLGVALRQGEHDLAALRFSALARQWPQAPAITQVAAAFESTSAGRLALARRIVAGDRWVGAYIQPGAIMPATALNGRAEVLMVVGALGKRLGCAPTAPIVASLAAVDPVRASRLWHAHCRDAAAPGSLNDPAFVQSSLTAPRVPFEWEFPGDGALRLDLVPTESGKRTLTASSSGALTLPIAAQRVVLVAGRYRVQVSGRVNSGKLLVSLACRREFSHADPQAIMGDSIILSFGGDCPAPWLQLWISPGGRAEIESVDLDPGQPIRN